MTAEIMTIKKLSQFLDLTEGTLYKKVSNNEIPYAKLGNLLRFPKWACDPIVITVHQILDLVNGATNWLRFLFSAYGTGSVSLPIEKLSTLQRMGILIESRVWEKSLLGAH